MTFFQPRVVNSRCFEDIPDASQLPPTESLPVLPSFSKVSPLAFCALASCGGTIGKLHSEGHVRASKQRIIAAALCAQYDSCCQQAWTIRGARHGRQQTPTPRCKEHLRRPNLNSNRLLAPFSRAIPRLVFPLPHLRLRGPMTTMGLETGLPRIRLPKRHKPPPLLGLDGGAPT